MMKKMITLVLTVLLLFSCSLQAQNMAVSRFHPTVHMGIGFPKVPMAIYRPPISLTGGISALYRIHNRVGLQLTGNALTTVSLGTASDVKADLAWNTQWATADVLIKISGLFRKENFILAGVGQYRHSQDIDGLEQEVTTTGMSLGLVNWSYKSKWATRFDVRWHLLFEPDEHPQMLTVTMGFML